MEHVASEGMERFGKSDIEGKTVREAASELGEGASFKWARAHESMRAAEQVSIG